MSANLAAAAPAVASNSPISTIYTFFYINFDGPLHNAATISHSGVQPNTGLAMGSDGSIYSTTSLGGYTGVFPEGTDTFGTLVRITPAGVGIPLVAFSGENGSYPMFGVTVGTDGDIYGTTFQGGVPPSDGIVFKVSPEGSFTTLYSFDSSGGAVNGETPSSKLVLGTDGRFYGSTAHGGASGGGTIFSITPSGVLTTLYDSPVYNGGSEGDGATIWLQANDGNFYGTASLGGDAPACGGSGCGYFFKMSPDGTMTTIAPIEPGGLSSGSEVPSPPFVNGLIQAEDGNFYGVSESGGTSGLGSIFRLTPDGAMTTLYSSTQREGLYPPALGADGKIYGTMTQTAAAPYGAIYSMTIDGEYSALESFNYHDGYAPNSLLALPDGSFYGSTIYGGLCSAVCVQGIRQRAARGSIFRFTP